LRPSGPLRIKKAVRLGKSGWYVGFFDRGGAFHQTSGPMPKEEAKAMAKREARAEREAWLLEEAKRRGA
jgi:hypothetical protein